MSAADISSLVLETKPLTPAMTVAEVGDLFLSGHYREMLSLPVVEQQRPVGSISRYELMKIYLHRFGREIYGKRRVSEFMNPKPLIVDVSQPLEAASEYITTNITFPVTEDFIITRDGEYAGVGMVISLLNAMEERVALNATELANAYADLKSSQTQLVQSEKMASLGQMVAGITHEINTPLGYVRNNIEMMEAVFGQARDLLLHHRRLIELFTSPTADEAALDAQLQIIQQQAGELPVETLQDMEALFRDTLYGVDQVSELVVNLKNFSRLDQAKLANVNLNDCLDSVLVIANNLLKNKVTVIKQYGEIPKIRCSPSQINQVLLNMVSNAAQAIEGSGKILLKTEADTEGVRIVVQDTGRGMPPEVMDKIFDPFFTTKPIGKGTGLGLSISHQIIEQHGGQIRVASKVGMGTRFTISLPMQSANKAAGAPQSPPVLPMEPAAMLA